MMIKPRLSENCHRLILVLLFLALFLVIPNGSMMADSNVPTVTNTPEPTHTPTQQPPTQPPPTQTQVPPTATESAILVIPTEVDESTGAIAVITPLPENASGGMSTLNRFLLVFLGITVVAVVGVVVFIFINQTRGSGLGMR